MGKRIALSENEKLNIQNLYKGILSEQQISDTPKTDQPISGGEKRGRLPGITDETTLCDIINGVAAVRRGDRGDLVKIFQNALIECGYSVGSAGADGIFGSDTSSAVSKFQRDNGLKVDRAIGPETSGALCQKGCLNEKCKQCQGYKQNPNIDDKKRGEDSIGTTPVKDGGINVDCEKVQGCISKFMGGLKEDFCIDEDKIKGLLQCVGIGQCFEGGKVPPSDMIKKPFPSDKTFDV